MGGGSWTSHKFASYSRLTKMGFDDATGRAIVGNEQLTHVHKLNEKLNPLNVIRECCDSEEHPNTVPVILALDVTGSMGQASIETASALGNIMKELYDTIPDVEVMIMGIGDFYCDNAPLQVSQFESDIRIAEQLDMLWHEHGGGGNNYESYTAAWAFGTYNCKLDCWNRGKKGIIITMGDEFINPYIDAYDYKDHVGGQLTENDLKTENLYEEAKKKFDIYHINVMHGYRNCSTDGWEKVLGDGHVISVDVKGIANTVVGIIREAINSDSTSANIPMADGGVCEVKIDENGAIGW